jgi:hypothetical protein
VTASAPMFGPYALAAFGDAIFEGEVSDSATENLALAIVAYQHAYGDIYSSPADAFCEPIRFLDRDFVTEHHGAEHPAVAGKVSQCTVQQHATRAKLCDLHPGNHAGESRQHICRRFWHELSDYKHLSRSVHAGCTRRARRWLSHDYRWLAAGKSHE